MTQNHHIELTEQDWLDFMEIMDDAMNYYDVRIEDMQHSEPQNAELMRESWRKRDRLVKKVAAQVGHYHE